MGQMGLGYGSEYQLLRFLGHHRHELEREILQQTQIIPELDYDMDWLDFPKKDTRDVLDGEYEGIEFFPEELRGRLWENWRNYWPQKGTSPNWDGIIYCCPRKHRYLKDKWIIVEAKAQLSELQSSCQAGLQSSKDKIKNAFDNTQKRFGIQTKNDWRENYYQLANRLAFVNFMLDNGIEGSLLYIYFINGWPNDPGINVTSKAQWKEAIDTEYAYLGINDRAKQYISEIFVECKES